MSLEALLPQLTRSLHQAYSLETLVRPVLSMLEQVTALESTYLTHIDLAEDVQHVLFAHNTAQMQIPEGLSVPWQDTLCQRALQEGRRFTNEVPDCWGDSQAAQALGIATYVSVPVTLSDGQLYGTLCAASSRKAALTPEAEGVLPLFAHLIGQQIEREQQLLQLQELNTQLAHLALTDSLTTLPNRAALREELRRMLARAQRNDTQVLVAFIDLDGFKTINDHYGHASGDRLLAMVAARLRASLRGGDLVARMGGDEFVLLASGPAVGETVAPVLAGLQARLHAALCCEVVLDDGAVLHYPGASVGLVAVQGDTSVDAALQQADAAMYTDKLQRGAAR